MLIRDGSNPECVSRTVYKRGRKLTLLSASIQGSVACIRSTQTQHLFEVKLLLSTIATIMFRSSKNSSSAFLTSITTYTSTSQLQSQPSSQTRPQKDYSAAFASLQSSYGFGGAVPTRHSTSKPQTSASVSRSRQTTQTGGSLIPPGAKDFEASFGALSSAYGSASVSKSSSK